MSSSPSSSPPPPSPSSRESQDLPDTSPPSKESEGPSPPPAALPTKPVVQEYTTATDKPGKKEIEDGTDDETPLEGKEEKEPKNSQQYDDPVAATAKESPSTTGKPDKTQVDYKEADDDEQAPEEGKEKESKDTHDSLETTTSPPSPFESTTMNERVNYRNSESVSTETRSGIENGAEMEIDEISEEKNGTGDTDSCKLEKPGSASDTQQGEPDTAPAASFSENKDNERNRIEVDQPGVNDDAKPASANSSSDTPGGIGEVDQPETKGGYNDDCDKVCPEHASENPDNSTPANMSLESLNQTSDEGDHVAGEPLAPPKDDPLPPLSLHDCVSLGEIELGLAQDNKAVEEIQCLPLLLRLLSLTRPLSTVDILHTDEGKRLKSSSPSSGEISEAGGDSLMNGLVARLEHVAATHSMAEGVDVVTCHLAPSMSRKLSKLSPLSTKQDGTWDTVALLAVARNPIPSSHRGSKRRRLSVESTSNDVQAQQSDDGIEGSSEDENETSMMVDEQNEDSTSNKRRRMYSLGGKRDSFGPGDGLAAEDSQEATFTKTLSELASLVASSLEALPSQETASTVEEAQQSEQPQTRSGQFSLTIDDSILAESGLGSDEGVGGAMARSDLGSTVASIMHHSPVLRSRHVAVSLRSVDIMYRSV